MRKRFVCGVFALAGLTGVPLHLALGHEAHKARCTETAINAASADIQAMPDGEAKAKAMQEMHMAEEMMAKKDFDGCVAHLHKATEAVEE